MRHLILLSRTGPVSADRQYPPRKIQHQAQPQRRNEMIHAAWEVELLDVVVPDLRCCPRNTGQHTRASRLRDLKEGIVELVRFCGRCCIWSYRIVGCWVDLVLEGGRHAGRSSQRTRIAVATLRTRLRHRSREHTEISRARLTKGFCKVVVTLFGVGVRIRSSRLLHRTIVLVQGGRHDRSNDSAND